jgi:hypothetical protein
MSNMTPEIAWAAVFLDCHLLLLLLARATAPAGCCFAITAVERLL